MSWTVDSSGFALPPCTLVSFLVILANKFLLHGSSTRPYFLCPLSRATHPPSCTYLWFPVPCTPPPRLLPLLSFFPSPSTPYSLSPLCLTCNISLLSCLFFFSLFSFLHTGVSCTKCPDHKYVFELLLRRSTGGNEEDRNGWIKQMRRGWFTQLARSCSHRQHAATAPSSNNYMPSPHFQEKKKKHAAPSS